MVYIGIAKLIYQRSNEWSAGRHSGGIGNQITVKIGVEYRHFCVCLTLIWKIRCEWKISREADPGKVHCEEEIKGRLRKALLIT